MDFVIVQRLKRAEGDLLSAIISNGTTPEQFSQDWLQLCIDIKSAVVSNELQDSTVQLAHNVASRVHLLSDNMLSLQEEVDSLTTKFEKGLNDLFAAMSLHEQSTDPPCPSMPRSTSSLPLYVKPAYSWLMKNLHNPYPPNHVKATISRESGCNVKDIDNWFINLRRRIGWNRVRRVYFANKRQEILSAAACFFGGADGFQTLDPHLEMEFASIQNAAENLYNDKFTGGQYSSRPESPRESCDSDANGSTECFSLPAICDAKDTRKRPPTNPKRSSSSFTCDPQIARKTKRHREDPETHSCKALKKRRIDATEGTTHTPSRVGTLLDDVPEVAVPAESTKTQSLSKRRRLSLSGIGDCTQPNGVESTPRNQTTPDPLPVEPLPSNIWPFDNAAFCSAFSAEQISQDLSAPLEIELFDPSRLFTDFGAVATTDGVHRPASHPDPLFHTPSIANYGEPSSHVEPSSASATPEESRHSEPSLLNVADPTSIPPQDFDWLFSLFDEKTFNNAYAYDTHAFSLPFDFGLTAPC